MDNSVLPCLAVCGIYIFFFSSSFAVHSYTGEYMNDFTDSMGCGRLGNLRASTMETPILERVVNEDYNGSKDLKTRKENGMLHHLCQEKVAEVLWEKVLHALWHWK